ncbi:MAG: hypothetical protein IMZ55_06425 [Acidobacteria bacterium]|nr:hypothetical protein [Acidobacteriota bacterium]
MTDVGAIQAAGAAVSLRLDSSKMAGDSAAALAKLKGYFAAGNALKEQANAKAKTGDQAGAAVLRAQSAANFGMARAVQSSMTSGMMAQMGGLPSEGGPGFGGRLRGIGRFGSGMSRLAWLGGMGGPVGHVAGLAGGAGMMIEQGQALTAGLGSAALPIMGLAGAALAVGMAFKALSDSAKESAAKMVSLTEASVQAGRDMRTLRGTSGAGRMDFLQNAYDKAVVEREKAEAAANANLGSGSVQEHENLKSADLYMRKTADLLRKATAEGALSFSSGGQFGALGGEYGGGFSIRTPQGYGEAVSKSMTTPHKPWLGNESTVDAMLDALQGIRDNTQHLAVQ